MQFRKALFPFSLIYALVTNLRNRCFDWNLLESKVYTIPVISIGNITVGGTGKTPFTEYCIRLLQKSYKIALLSRGYKRKTKGVVMASQISDANQIGDEPFQVLSKFPSIDVVVAEKRVDGMAKILVDTAAQVVLMDDAYQHRYVKPGLSVLVIDYNRPLWSDMPFPAGNLRETSRGQNRADVIVVNKCPAKMDATEKQRWLIKLKAHTHQQVYFSTIKYGKLNSTVESKPIDGAPIIVLTGIARPEPFLVYVKSHYKVARHLMYADHHNYTKDDIISIQKALEEVGEEAQIITTEKDYTRLKSLSLEFKQRVSYIPIELEILFEEEKEIETTISNYVRDHQKNS